MRRHRERERRNKTKLNVAFRNFAILPKNGHRPYHSSSIYLSICHRERSGSITSHCTCVQDEQFGNGSGTLPFPCQYYSFFVRCSFIHHRRHVTVSDQIRSWVHDTLKIDCRYEKLVAHKLVGYECTRELINVFPQKRQVLK